MRKPASGTPAHIQTIPADQLHRVITVLEGRMRDAEEQSERESLSDYYLGRLDAFKLAISYLREVSK